MILLIDNEPDAVLEDPFRFLKKERGISYDHRQDRPGSRHYRRIELG